MGEANARLSSPHKFSDMVEKMAALSELATVKYGR